MECNLNEKLTNFKQKILKELNLNKLNKFSFIELCKHDSFLERFCFTKHANFFVCLFRSSNENQLS